MGQGCGGGGSTPTPAPAPAPPAKPMSVSEAAVYLNAQYLAFNESDDKSFLGITVSMAAQVNSFWKNIYCSKFENPILHITGCSQARGDCRLSASLYNHAIGVNATGETVLGLGRATGYVFNQTMTENYWGKCSYLWDGATDRKYNNGCGDGAVKSTCEDPESAWGDICPSTGKICTAEDKEVVRGFCKGYGKLHLPEQADFPSTHDGHVQCAIPGPAINYHGQEGWTPAPDHMRDMAKQRVKFIKGKDKEGPNIEKYSEVVIDERLLIPKIRSQPTLAIVAFIYLKDKNAAQNKQNAEAMRDEYCHYASLTGDLKIPVVGVDATIGAGQGPFVADVEETEVAI